MLKVNGSPRGREALAASTECMGHLSRQPRCALIRISAIAAISVGVGAPGAQAQSTDPCPCSEKKECPAPAGFVSGGSGGASGYPNKPIRLIVPFPPGGSLDIQARVVGTKLSERLKVPVVVDNKPGAGGTVATDFAARSEADGYTLLVGNVGSHVIAPLVYPKVTYDPARDFSPVASLSASPYVLVVHPSIKADTPNELLQILRSRPGQLSYATSGTGGFDHVAGELFSQLTGTKMTQIPYRGAGPATNDLIGGQVQVMFAPLTSAVDHVKSGKLRAVGIASGRRSTSLPQVTTFDEAGVRDFVAKSWIGVFVPAKTPKDIADRLNAEINAIIKSEDVASRMTSSGADPCPQTREAFAGLIRDSSQKWARVVKQANIKAE